MFLCFDLLSLQEVEKNKAKVGAAGPTVLPSSGPLPAGTARAYQSVAEADDAEDVGPSDKPPS